MKEKLEAIAKLLTEFLDEHGKELEDRGMYRGSGGLSEVEDSLQNIIAEL